MGRHSMSDSYWSARAPNRALLSAPSQTQRCLKRIKKPRTWPSKRYPLSKMKSCQVPWHRGPRNAEYVC